MYPIELTQRMITHHWETADDHAKEVATDETVYVNPELIEFVRPATDAPHKYRSLVRMHSGWDLFVVEPPGLIDSLIRRARYNVLLERVIEKP